MTEPRNPSGDPQGGDETFSWSQDEQASATGNAKGTAGSTATAIIDQVRDVVDDLAERAGPTVREISARAAELTAIAADKAAPLAKKAGEVTADASGKLASKSREWASELRSPAPGHETNGGDAAAPTSPKAGFEPAEGTREEDSGQPAG